MKITLPIGKSTINDHFTPFYIAAFVYQIPQFEHLNFKHSQSPLLVLFCHLYFLYFWISQRSPKEFIAKSPNEQCSKPSVVPLYIFILLGSLHGLNCDHLCIGRFITPQYHQPTVPKASTARPLDCTFHLVYGGLKLPDLFVQAQNVLARGAPGAPGTLMKIRECTNNTPMELKVVQITYPLKKMDAVRNSIWPIFIHFVIHFVPKFSISFPAIWIPWAPPWNHRVLCFCFTS